MSGKICFNVVLETLTILCQRLVGRLRPVQPPSRLSTFNTEIGREGSCKYEDKKNNRERQRVREQRRLF